MLFLGRSCHINSIEKDSLSNYLISMRGPSTIYYISGTTGEILWRLGGKNSNFTMGTDASFWYQHDARFHSDTSVSPFNISLFDNAAGGAGDAEATARAIMLSVDTDAMTAELVYSVTPSFNTTAPSQGSNTVSVQLPRPPSFRADLCPFRSSWTTETTLSAGERFLNFPSTTRECCFSGGAVRGSSVLL